MTIFDIYQHCREQVRLGHGGGHSQSPSGRNKDNGLDFGLQSSSRTSRNASPPLPEMMLRQASRTGSNLSSCYSFASAANDPSFACNTASEVEQCFNREFALEMTSFCAAFAKLSSFSSSYLLSVLSAEVRVAADLADSVTHLHREARAMARKGEPCVAEIVTGKALLLCGRRQLDNARRTSLP